MFNVYSLLEQIHARPRMFFGKPSLTGLDDYLAGYYAALAEHKVEFESVGIWRFTPQGQLPEFNLWVSQRIRVGGSNRGYAALILDHTNGDEVAALALFWELLDEYRALERAIDDVVLPQQQ